MGTAIQQRRKAAGMTVEQLAVKAQTAAKTVSRVEAGHNVRMVTLSRIAAALGTTLAVVFSEAVTDEVA